MRNYTRCSVIPRRPQADVGIRSLFPGPAPHTRGCGLPRRFAPRNDSFLICVRFISLLSFRGGRRPTWESVLFFPVPHRTQGDADCRVAGAPRNDTGGVLPPMYSNRPAGAPHFFTLHFSQQKKTPHRASFFIFISPVPGGPGLPGNRGAGRFPDARSPRCGGG